MHRSVRLLGAGVAVTALIALLAGFLGWSNVTLAGSGTATLSGWGTIGGPDTAAGENINDVVAGLGGSGSYRPALLSTVLAVPGLMAGIWIAIRRSKFAAAGAVALGLFLAAWGLYRVVRPGDVAGLLEAGDVSAAAMGPWVTLGVGVAMVGAAGAVLLLSMRAPAVGSPSRGIQLRR